MSTSLLPPGLLRRVLRAYRIHVAPGGLETPPRPWAPLSDDEWEHVAPYLAATGCGLSFTRRPGRPPEDTRARLDAIFRAVTLKHPKGGRAAWDQLPEGFGKPDSVSRSFRRWARRGLWARLLTEVACRTCPPVLRALTCWICCAFRRGYRVLGLPAVLLARRLRLHSALPAPSLYLHDPHLSESLRRAVPAVVEWVEQDPVRRGGRRGPLRGLLGLLRIADGRRIARWMEPA